MIDTLIFIARNKRLLIGFPMLVAVVTAVVSLFIPNVYTAASRILPPQQPTSVATALLAQLGSLGQIAGQAVGLKNPADLYVGILRSRTIADKLIDKFGLQQLYDRETLVETREELANRTTIFAGKDGLITVEFQDEDPIRAANIADAYIEELQTLTQTLAVTEASQRRLFFERQVAQTRDDLTKAELEFQRVQEKTGLLKLDEQSHAIIESIAAVRAEIASKEVQLATMRTFSTATNPDLMRVERQLAALKAQLAKLEQGTTAAKGSILVPTGRIPEAGLEYLRRLRDLKYQETLFELMAKQLELAKVDEAKDVALIQVLDKAAVPDKKSSPKRFLIVLVALFTAFFVGLLVALLKEAHENALADPSLAPKYRALLALLPRPLRH